MIPLPRAWLLTSALLVGSAAGQLAAVLTTLLIKVSVRPDVVVGLVIGLPSVIGLLFILAGGRRWATSMGAFILAMAPGWLSVLVLVQLVSHA